MRVLMRVYNMPDTRYQIVTSLQHRTAEALHAIGAIGALICLPPCPSTTLLCFTTNPETPRYGMVLRQCAHFYNTIGSQMIESQKPLMLADALDFEKVRAGAKGRGGSPAVGTVGHRCVLGVTQLSATCGGPHTRFNSAMNPPSRCFLLW